jgi:hypothetical protein
MLKMLQTHAYVYTEYFIKNNARHIPAGHSCHPLYQRCTRVYSLSGTDHPKNVRSDFDRDVWRKRRIAFSFI